MCKEFNLDCFRELCENTLFLEQSQRQFNNKKVAKYYKKIQKLKSKIAKIYGVEYGNDL